MLSALRRNARGLQALLLASLALNALLLMRPRTSEPDAQGLQSAEGNTGSEVDEAFAARVQRLAFDRLTAAELKAAKGPLVFPDAPFPRDKSRSGLEELAAAGRLRRASQDDDEPDGAGDDRHPAPPPARLKVEPAEDDDAAGARRVQPRQGRHGAEQQEEDDDKPRDKEEEEEEEDDDKPRDAVGARAEERDRDDDDGTEPIVDVGAPQAQGKAAVPAPPPPGMENVVEISEDNDEEEESGTGGGLSGAGGDEPEGAPPFRGLLRERKTRVMMAIISGGIKPTTKANREAVIKTWFDENTYIATHEDVPTDRVLWLSDEAESGGFKDLPRKVKHMWAYMYENFIDKYDWFVKADDDTYVSMKRLETTLSAFNPDIPVYLGKPFASKIRGAAGPNALWRDFTTMSFCHGGSGYIMSRELLRRVGPFIQGAHITTSLEDAAVASVLYEHTGVRCINLNSKMFGGLDLAANSHDQKLIQNMVKNFEKRQPEILVKTATIHSVTAETTYILHDLYGRLDALGLDDKVDRLAELDLEARRWLYSSSWNCSLPPVLDNQVGHAAICMQSALLSSPPFPPRHLADLDSAWRITKPGLSCTASSTVDKSRVFGWASFKPASLEVDSYGREFRPDSGAPLTHDSDAEKRNVILVSLDSDDDSAVDAFELLVRSLRATGSVAEVVVLSQDPSTVAAAASVGCGVTLVEFDPIKVRAAVGAWSGVAPSDDMMSFGLFEAFLFVHGQIYNRVMHVHADTFFQRDPFAATVDPDGLVLFVDDPVVTMEQVDCYPGILRLNELVTRISLSVAIGKADTMRAYYSRAVTVPYRQRRCPFEDSVMLQLFRKELSAYFPVTLLQPWDGPAVLLNDANPPLYVNGTGSNAGRILFINTKGVVATVVSNTLRQMDAAPDVMALRPPHMQRTPLEMVLNEVPRRIHGAVRLAAEVQRLPPKVWPADSKANLRLSGLGGAGRSVVPYTAFRPVWELLARYKAYNTNSTRPRVERVANPATHKTGAALLSAVLFRFASRHKLRMFHRGEWPFLAPEVLQSPSKEWKEEYDIVFSALSPKGQWHSDYAIASDFYNFLLGENHARTLMLQDPHQHYVSWLYYYIIPKKTRFKPADVVADFVKHRLNRNLLCQELNLRRIDQLNDFIANELPRFDIVFVKERIDECLVLMRRRFNWNMLDVTYMPFPRTTRRFDGKPLPNVVKSRDLDPVVSKGIEGLVKMDDILYKAANKRLDELIAAEGPDFKQELEGFQKVQAALNDICKKYQQHAFCKWYWLEEMDFFHMIGPDGYTQAVPMI